MHVVVSIYVDQDNYLAIQETKCHHSFFAIILPRVFTGYGEISNIAAVEVLSTFGASSVGCVKIPMVANVNRLSRVPRAMTRIGGWFPGVPLLHPRLYAAARFAGYLSAFTETNSSFEVLTSSSGPNS